MFCSGLPFSSICNSISPHELNFSLFPQLILSVLLKFSLQIKVYPLRQLPEIPLKLLFLFCVYINLVLLYYAIDQY